MTKLLDIENGEFATFITSAEYDLASFGEVMCDSFTIVWENSYAYSQGLSIESRIKLLCRASKRDESSFEIVYD